jgi:hypothetical protein
MKNNLNISFDSSQYKVDRPPPPPPTAPPPSEESSVVAHRRLPSERRLVPDAHLARLELLRPLCCRSSGVSEVYLGVRRGKVEEGGGKTGREENGEREGRTICEGIGLVGATCLIYNRRTECQRCPPTVI